MEVENLIAMPKLSETAIADFTSTTHQAAPTAVEIQEWIVTYLAQLLETNPDEIDVTLPFDRYGLDSSVAVGLTGDLEDWLETRLDPTILYDYPTIETMSKHLAEELRSKQVVKLSHTAQ
jgi:acyl carrier protein